MPPLPPIPESLHSSLAPSGLGKMVRRMRSRSALTQKAAQSAETAAFKPQSGELLTRTPRKLKIPFKRSTTRSTISSPELQFGYDSPTLLEFSNTNSFISNPSQSAPASRRQSIISPVEAGSASAADDSDDGPLEWTVAAPRLSPMEYARTFLIQSARMKKDNNPASAELTKLWFWTPKWETFLVVPRKPAAVLRKGSVASSFNDEISQVYSEPALHETGAVDAVDPEPPAGDRRGFFSCPRLSLNLGNIAIQLPSLLNMKSFDGVHASHSLSASSKSGSPATSVANSDIARKSSERTPSTTVPVPARVSLQKNSSEKAKLVQSWDTPSTTPTADLARLFVRVDDASTHPLGHAAGLPNEPSHQAMQITDNPFQDGAIYDRARIPEARPCALEHGSSHAAQPSPPAASCSNANTSNGAGAAPRNIGLATLTPGSAIVRQSVADHRRRAVGGQVVTPVEARKLGKLVAGMGSVVSMHAQSEDFALPDSSDEERELRPLPLQVRRQRSRSRGGTGGLRERDTTRRNLFSSNDPTEEDVNGLLRHLGGGDPALLSGPFDDDEQASPWSPFYQGHSGHQPSTPSARRRRSSVPSSMSLTPTQLRAASSPLLATGANGQEEHSGLSPRLRKTASTYQPLPDSPTLPVVGPQVKIKRASRCLPHDSLNSAPLGNLMRFALPPKPRPATKQQTPSPDGAKKSRSSSFLFTPRRPRKPKAASSPPVRSDSSFALHKAASHDAFTLLPKLSVGRRRSSKPYKPSQAKRYDYGMIPNVPCIPNASTDTPPGVAAPLTRHAAGENAANPFVGLDAVLSRRIPALGETISEYRPPLSSSSRLKDPAELSRWGGGAGGLSDYLKLDNQCRNNDKPNYSHLSQAQRNMHTADAPGQGRNTGSVVEAKRGGGGGPPVGGAYHQQRHAKSYMQGSTRRSTSMDQGPGEAKGLEYQQPGPDVPATRGAATAAARELEYLQQQTGNQEQRPAVRQPVRNPAHLSVPDPPPQLTALGVTSRTDGLLLRPREGSGADGVVGRGTGSGVLGILRGSEVKSRNKIRKSGRNGVDCQGLGA